MIWHNTMIWHDIKLYVFPVGADFLSHLWMGVIFLFWWMSRCAGDPDTSVRSARLPMGGEEWWWSTTGAAPADPKPAPADSKAAPRRRGRRRIPIVFAGLVFIFVVGTAIPLLTWAVAEHPARVGARILPPPEMNP
ncbi:MAG TPA: hypothetical protein VFJ58_15325 [Armatimonadota bacterium]|nr:hypothetical protein [Armatimonadota bacterium]